MEPVHKALHQRETSAPGGPDGLLSSFGVLGERLFAEDVLARIERPERPLHVHRVRQRYVDSLHLRVLEKRGVVLEKLGAGRRFADRAGLLATPGSDGRYLDCFRTDGSRDNAAEGDSGCPRIPKRSALSGIRALLSSFLRVSPFASRGASRESFDLADHTVQLLDDRVRAVLGVGFDEGAVVPQRPILATGESVPQLVA